MPHLYTMHHCQYRVGCVTASVLAALTLLGATQNWTIPLVVLVLVLVLKAVVAQDRSTRRLGGSHSLVTPVGGRADDITRAQ
jgi:hypothetical protein